MAIWIWDNDSREYTATQEAAQHGIKPGTIFDANDMVRMRDEYTDSLLEDVGSLSTRLSQGDIDLDVWVQGMRDHIKNSHINQYVMGHGGRGSMTPADWGRTGWKIRDQYGHLDKFALKIQQGELSELQIKARANQYVEGSTSMFERASVLARGMPDLDEYPGDGNQQCHSNCRCTWDIQDKGTFWECVWVLDIGAEHCDDCLGNNSKWNPLIVQKGG